MKFKKIGMLAICLILFLSATQVFADVPIKSVKGATVDLTKYDIIHPTEVTLSTTDKNMIVNGKAIPGSKVTIEHFGTSDLNKKSYDLDNLPPSKEYLSLLKEDLKTGNMGFFQKQLVLVGGVNKIKLVFEDKNIAPVEIIIHVTEKDEATDKEIKITNVKPLLK